MRKLPIPGSFPLILSLVLAAAPVLARDVSVPEPLKPWMGWIAAKHPGLACPTDAEGGDVCVTYGSLKLDLGDQGGSFSQAVTVFGTQWVRLPGSPEAWPKDIRDGSLPVPVVLKDGFPQARLAQGEHALSGDFSWSECPAALQVPENTALLTLRLKGRDIPSPEMDGGSALQLGVRARRDTSEAEAPLSLRVYRKLMDGIPMRLETFLTISVSGRDREILTGRFLPEGSAVLSIESGLPMRIGPDGRLRAQIRSGEHTIRVVSRFLAPVASLAMVKLDSLWPDEEIWSFEAQRDLRVVELSGAPLIDPSQSGLPEEWKGLPAYRMQPGDTLRIEEKQRGNPAPQSGNLNLRRDMWLDFAGKGFTIRDRLGGALQLRSRLEMGGGYQLGRAEVDNNPVMLTSLKDRSGVEVPAGRLDMLALSRFDRRGGALSATGWNQSFGSVQATLHLPPGWKLIHAEGPDTVGNSWVTEWSLWDVFLLCILTLGALRLGGWKIALVALPCFVLLSQEEGLSGLLWLNLLAAIGLWRVLPQGRLRAAANAYRIISLAVMAAIWIPFAVAHARKALYPQLDGPGSTSFRNANYSLLSGPEGYGGSQVVMKLVAPQQMEPPQAPAAGEAMNDMQVDKAEEAFSKRMPRKMGSSNVQVRRNRFNDNASKVQSGPGEPEWNWETASLYWSGPVQDGETLGLILVRPWLTRILRALQAILPGLLLLLLAFPMAAGLRPRGKGLGAGAGAMAVLLMLFSAAPVRADYPPDSLLKELEARMTAVRSCAPGCAAMNSGRITVADDHISIALVFDVVDTSLAILPQAGEGQLSLVALRVGARPAAGAVKLSNGRLAIALPRGRHAVVMEGRILGPRLELNFGDEARNLTVQAPEYSLQGLTNGTTGGGALVLQRREGAASVHKGPELTPDPVPPYVEVVRTLVLDKEWTLETRVLRIAPGEGAFTVEVPLPAFEHPTTPGMAQSKGFAMVSLQEGQAEANWHSVVDRAPILKLAAGPLDRRSETWSVDASSRWHVETSGIPPILPKDGGGEPQWMPLPGDTLAIAISEPAAATGPVKTIETAALTLTPGKRESTANLRLRIRAGQGDVTRVTLPPSAHLENLTIDGAAQTLTQREGVLALPLHPGVQNIVLDWKQPEGIRLLQKTPKLELDDEAANISLSINAPADRWILWVGGNAIGPALLLWGVLIVLFAVAALLGRAGITPLGGLDWALLFLGTSMVNLYATAPLLAMFLALRYREKRAAAWSANEHNLFQILCAALAVAGFGMLLAAVPEGLLSAPDMQVTGNGSSAGYLRWFLDRTRGSFPTGWMFSLPLWIYRLAMLAWSLWLAWRLLQWLKWSWERFSAGGIWRQRPKAKPSAGPSANPPNPPDNPPTRTPAA
ncbi:MAG: hypothetical protein JWO30_3968 [Fibrobacteres bacterium]|nr:hypothetical protein [Fibrobacterota bacterium]